MALTDRDTLGTRVGRWVLVIVVPIVAWHAVLVLGLLSTGILDAFCPQDQRMYGSCTADWYMPAIDALIVGWTGVSAFVVVVTAAVIAPSHRVAVGTLAFLCGAAIAASIAIDLDSYAEFAAAIVCGALALLVTAWKLGTPSPRTPDGTKG